MKLRNLELKDAPLMLEWMHDKNVTVGLSSKFSGMGIEDCEKFILSGIDMSQNLHLAVADDDDTYMGTVSLKHIDRLSQTAEFAITVRSCAMGKGYSKYAMAEILDIGIKKLKLNAIYWCVFKTNARAVRFYDKNGYRRIQAPPDEILNYYPDSLDKFYWYKFES